MYEYLQNIKYEIVGRHKKLPVFENILICDIAAEGKAIAKIDDLVVFVEGAIPGDIVTIQVTKKKKRFCEGRILSFSEYSADRLQAFCKHFGVCGGCKWQILPYAKQLQYKEKQVIDQLTRIGHLEIAEKLPILASQKTELYRNKLEFTFSNKRWITAGLVTRTAGLRDLNALPEIGLVKREFFSEHASFRAIFDEQLGRLRGFWFG